MVYSAKKVMEMNACDGGNSCVAKLVSVTLERMIRENCVRQASLNLMPSMSAAQDNSTLLFVKFQSSYEPDVSIEFYIDRIHKYSKCSDTCLVIMLIYIDRLIERRGLVLSSLNAHRVILTSLMISAKYHDDLFYNNAYYAKLGGVPLNELNSLEIDFLAMHEFSMFVDTATFDKYYQQLQHYKFLMLQQQPAIISSPLLVIACNSPSHHPMSQQYSPCRGQIIKHSSSCENAFQFSPHSVQHSQLVPNQQHYINQQQHSPSDPNINSYFGQSLFPTGLSCDQAMAYSHNGGLIMTSGNAGYHPAFSTRAAPMPSQPVAPMYKSNGTVPGMPMLVPSPVILNGYGQAQHGHQPLYYASNVHVTNHHAHEFGGMVPATGSVLYPFHQQQNMPTPQSFHQTVAPQQHVLSVGSFAPSSSLSGSSVRSSNGGLSGSFQAAQSYARRVTSRMPPQHHLLSVGF